MLVAPDFLSRIEEDRTPKTPAKGTIVAAAETRSSNENAPIGCIFGNGAFIGAAWKGRILRSTDALVWKEVAKLPHNIEGIAFE